MEKKGYSIFVSSLFLIAIVVCFISDVVVHNQFTWSILVVVSLAFSWGVIIPSIKLGIKGISRSLIVLTILLLPYLYILGYLLQVEELFGVGTCISLVSLWYLWSVYFLFKTLKKRQYLVLGITCFLGIPLSLFIHIILVRFAIENNLTSWDYLSFFIMLLLSIIFIGKDYFEYKKLRTKRKYDL